MDTQESKHIFLFIENSKNNIHKKFIFNKNLSIESLKKLIVLKMKNTDISLHKQISLSVFLDSEQNHINESITSSKINECNICLMNNDETIYSLFDKGLLWNGSIIKVSIQNNDLNDTLPQLVFNSLTPVSSSILSKLKNNFFAQSPVHKSYKHVGFEYEWDNTEEDNDFIIW